MNLTEREKEILPLFAEGLTDKEIADKLFISVRTVRNHFVNICTKFCIDGVLRRTKLCVYYFSHFKS